MNIVGLGSGGIRIAELFEKYEQYTIYKIGSNIQSSETSFNFPLLENPEDYENNCPDLSAFFKNIKDEVLFITVGSSNITGASLRILQQLSSCKITVLYVRPDINLLSSKKALQEKITFNVFQEYARSGLFSKLYLVDNLTIESIIGEIPVTQYHKKINDMIVQTLHMLNVYKHNEPVFISGLELPKISNISTFGLSDFKTGKDGLFYNLNNTTYKIYYYSISKDFLEKDGKLLIKIKNQVREKSNQNTKSGFLIYENSYPENYVYVELHTHILQNVINEA